MQISNLQFITNYQSKVSHFEQAKQAIEGGIDWIQYRPKDSDIQTIEKEAREIAMLCKKNGVTFIMNDRVDVAKCVDADGVHLGKSDMSPLEARGILGENKIIGGTTNSSSDIEELVQLGVDYIGLGPYKFTSTKKNLSPVLGLNGYHEIVTALQHKNIAVPIVAIGGITEAYFNTIMETGIFGLAISSLISEGSDISQKSKELIELLKQ